MFTSKKHKKRPMHICTITQISKIRRGGWFTLTIWSYFYPFFSFFSVSYTFFLTVFRLFYLFFFFLLLIILSSFYTARYNIFLYLFISSSWVLIFFFFMIFWGLYQLITLNFFFIPLENKLKKTRIRTQKKGQSRHYTDWPQLTTDWFGALGVLDLMHQG